MSDDAALRATVERMLRDGQSFKDVERFIAAQPIPKERRADLWLYAWDQTHKVSWDREDRTQNRQGTAPPLP
jgi:hypothetical protein